MSGIRMSEQYDDEQERIRRYLLGRLADDERQLIEERVFTDPAFFQNVRMTEEELLEDYVFKTLSPEDSERFAKRLLLTPEQTQRWELVTGLKKYSERIREQTTPTPIVSRWRSIQSGWALPIAATVIVAVVVGVWIMRAHSLERAVAELNAPGQSGGTESDFPIELPALRLRSQPQADTPEPRFTVPKGVNVVQIRLPVEVDAYVNYQTTLMREPDSTLFTLNDHPPVEIVNRKVLTVRVPADALTPGDYRLVIKGTTADKRIDDLGIYLFAIL